MDKVVHPPQEEALRMLDVFESVGAGSFDLTTTDEQGNCCEFAAEQTSEVMKAMLPDLLPQGAEKRLNIIIRPRLAIADRRLIQLDDLGFAGVERVEQLAFLVVETSAENFQAWLAVAGADEDTARRLKKQIGSDKGASGAVRIAGSRNFKPKHSPDYPEVKIRAVESGRVVSVADLESHSLLAELPPPCVLFSACSPGVKAALPDYEQFSAGAHMTGDGRVDRSSLDYAWAATALKRGHSLADVARELDSVSRKAATLKGRSRKSYIKRTIEAAARGVGLI